MHHPHILHSQKQEVQQGRYHEKIFVETGIRRKFGPKHNLVLWFSFCSSASYFRDVTDWVRKCMWGFFLLELLMGDMRLTLALVLPQAIQENYQPWSKLHRLPACWQLYKYRHKEGREHLENCQAIVTWIKVSHILGPNYSSHNKITLWIHFSNASYMNMKCLFFFSCKSIWIVMKHLFLCCIFDDANLWKTILDPKYV